MNLTVFVVSDILGPMAAGAGRAAALLADELSELGINVTAYTAEPKPDIEGSLCTRAHTRIAWLQHGCRWIKRRYAACKPLRLAVRCGCPVRA